MGIFTYFREYYALDGKETNSLNSLSRFFFYNYFFFTGGKNQLKKKENSLCVVLPVISFHLRQMRTKKNQVRALSNATSSKKQIICRVLIPWERVTSLSYLYISLTSSLIALLPLHDNETGNESLPFLTVSFSTLRI